MKNYFLTAVCGLFLVSAASNVKAECKTTPDCTAMGYTKTEKDCPNGSIKCPWNTSLVFCDAEIVQESLACQLITAVTVPANGHCTGTNVNCPSKCTEWACNDGYTKSGETCNKIVAKTCASYGYSSTKKPATSWTCVSVNVGGLSCYDCTEKIPSTRDNCPGGMKGTHCYCTGGTHSRYQPSHVCMKLN